MSGGDVLARMTERQRAAWPEAIAELKRYSDSVQEDPDHHMWRVTFEEESRPGRGQLLDATICDGEHYAQIRMDVYGYPSVCIGAVHWIHGSSDEECDCDFCVKEREADDE